MKIPFPQILLTAMLSASVSSLLAQSASPAPIRIVLLGDSTVASREGGEKATYGWGYSLQEVLGPGYMVSNHAKGGRSTKSFWNEKRVAPALQEHPDYVVVQFGHNDQPGKGEDRETDPNTTYRDNLRQYIQAIREAGAKPVLVTSIVRRNFRPDGHLNNNLRPYAEAMIEVAREENVPCFDLNAVSLEYFEKLGREKSIAYNPAPTDFTHFDQKGAREISVLVADFLKKTIPAATPAPSGN